MGANASSRCMCVLEGGIPVRNDRGGKGFKSVRLGMVGFDQKRTLEMLN